MFTDEEQEIYLSFQVYEHPSWALGNSSHAQYHKDIDTVLIELMNTTGNNPVVMTQ